MHTRRKQAKLSMKSNMWHAATTETTGGARTYRSSTIAAATSPSLSGRLGCACHVPPAPTTATRVASNTGRSILSLRLAGGLAGVFTCPLGVAEWRPKQGAL